MVVKGGVFLHKISWQGGKGPFRIMKFQNGCRVIYLLLRMDKIRENHFQWDLADETNRNANLMNMT